MMKKELKFQTLYITYRVLTQAFTTTTTHIELEEALKQGYRITHIYRALHWYRIFNEINVKNIYRESWYDF